jgi:O-antigen ligase
LSPVPPARWLVLGLFLVGLALSITLSQATLALLGVFWLLRLRDPAVRATVALPLGWPFLALAVATLVSALAAANPWASLAAAKSLLLAIAFFGLANFLEDAGEAGWFLSGLLLLMAAVSLLGVAQVAFCPEHPWTGTLLERWTRKCHRARGFYSIYMTLAGVLTLVLLATLPRLLPGPGRRRWWWPAAWALCALGLLFTYTRGAWLGVLAGTATLAGLLRRAWLILGVGGLVLATLVLLAGGALEQRFRSLVDPEDATFRERLLMWESGLAILRDHPVTGVGIGQLKVVYPGYALDEAVKKHTSHLHNTPLQIAAERGILGLVAWLWLWVAFFRRGLGIFRGLPPDRGRERRLVAGSLGAIAGFLVAGLSEYNFGDSEVVMVAYVAMAVPFVVERAAGLTSSAARRPGAP